MCACTTMFQRTKICMLLFFFFFHVWEIEKRVAKFCIVQFSEAFLWENLQFSHNHKCGYVVNNRLKLRSRCWELLLKCVTFFIVCNFAFLLKLRQKWSEKSQSNLFWDVRCGLIVCSFQMSTFHFFSVSIEKPIPIVFFVCENVTQFTHSLEFKHFHWRRHKYYYEIELFKSTSLF